MISFRVVCSLTALVCLILFAIFLVAPGAYSAGYGVPADRGAVFLGNRAAPLFMGLAAICWLFRTHTAYDVQWTVGLSMIVVFAGIAMTGVWAYLQGNAAASILIAALGELVVVAAFAQTLRRTT